jgi:hypothetical protein
MVLVMKLTLRPDLNIAVSSAKSETWALDTEFGRSFIMMRKSRGEMIEPWAVPFSTDWMDYRCFPTLTWKVRFVMKSMIQL